MLSREGSYDGCGPGRPISPLGLPQLAPAALRRHSDAAAAALPLSTLEPRRLPLPLPPFPRPMSSTPSFDALLPTLLASLPPAEPYAIHLPLLCAVLSRLNEPQAITTLFDATVDHLPAVAGSVAEPSWSGVIQTEWTSLDGKAAGALVLAVRIREALLKVRRPSWGGVDSSPLAPEQLRRERVTYSRPAPADQQRADQADSTPHRFIVSPRPLESLPPIDLLTKSFPLLGFPLTISALTTFSSHLAESHPEVWKVIERLESTQPFPTAFEPLGPKVPLHEAKPTGAPGGKEEPLVEVSRGRRLFNSIYGKVSGRVIESLRWGHPNLVDCALKLIVRRSRDHDLLNKDMQAD